ncbi:MAG: ankyrin repeat domain-containing protein [Myxococcota bacterium]
MVYIDSLHSAASRGDTAWVFYFLKYEKKSVNERDTNGNTALYYASKNGNFYTTKLLLQWQAAVIGTGTDPQETALHEAAERNQHKIAELLLQHRPDLLDRKDGTGRTPLHHACALGHVNMVQILLGFGANPNIKDQKGNNAWTHAAHAPETTWHQVVEVLMESEQQRQHMRHEIQEALKQLGLQDLSSMLCQYANCSDEQ